MVAKIKFLFTDANDCFLIPQSDIDNFHLDGVEISAEYLYNNKNPISNNFNRVLREVRTNNDHDYVVFMHGDVKLDLVSFVSHLLTVEGKYDIIGLAGTKKLDLSYCPINWFTGSLKTPNTRYGMITMTKDDKDVKCFYNSDRANVMDTEVACIDGLCIVFCKNALNSNIEFDENIAPFDLYDTDICMNAIMNYKMRIGVIVEDTYHKSVGASILSHKFKEYDAVFRKKWNLK